MEAQVPEEYFQRDLWVIPVPDSKLKLLGTCFDRSFVFYDSIVENVKDEAVMLIAQNLTASALDRISILNNYLHDATV